MYGTGVVDRRMRRPCSPDGIWREHDEPVAAGCPEPPWSLIVGVAGRPVNDGGGATLAVALFVHRVMHRIHLDDD